MEHYIKIWLSLHGVTKLYKRRASGIGLPQFGTGAKIKIFCIFAKVIEYFSCFITGKADLHWYRTV